MGCGQWYACTACRSASGPVRAVDEADLYVEQGELVALVGPSACGKTSLLRLIAGFEHPDEGEIQLDGTRRRRPRRFAAAGASPRRHGVPGLCAVPAPVRRRERRLRRRPPRARRRVAELLDLVGLGTASVAIPTSFPAASSNAWRSRVRSRRAPRSCCSTSLGATSTRFCAARCATSSRRSCVPPASRYCSSPTTARRRSRSPTASPSCATGASFRLAARGSVPRPGRPLDGRVRGSGQLPPRPRRRRAGRDARSDASRCYGKRRAQVDVLIRPEQLKLRTDPAGRAEVVAREFRGHDVFYRLRLDDGTTLVSQRPSTEDVPLGARVSVTPSRSGCRRSRSRSPLHAR